MGKSKTFYYLYRILEQSARPLFSKITTNIYILNQYDPPECILRQFESTLREELRVYQKESLNERKRLKKMLTEADNEIKNMKVRYATGKIDKDIYEVAIREMQNRKDVLTLELEKCNDNLSNPKPQQVL